MPRRIKALIMTQSGAVTKEFSTLSSAVADLLFTTRRHGKEVVFEAR